MQDLTDDYLAAEPELIALLDQVEGLRKVYSTADLAELKERSQITPAAHVIYWGDAVPDTAQGGNLSHVTQTWVVVLAVNLRKKDEAGPLLARIIQQLSGARISLGPVQRINPIAKPTFSGGFGYYPLAFNFKFRIKGARP
ncbi:hypothetical protein QKW35_20565 [Pontibacterium granulatum]|uniref:phage tail terminator protein n=1 Tax=Pontibacterium granulatum TaxID=2036029 RepID=UPI00249A7C8F|nr:hypothetical protein [Pontibacterium granulatum]MDI3326777.1 hypothetical protein [Pontibacterium granulatum]